MSNATPSQLKAIHSEGKNILVSAGAGSGKTTVLSERVLRKALQGIHVDQLMIVTYTNAAAAEMKHRIAKKISEAAKSHPHLNEETQRLNNAMIATFDSFALQIVKEYHYRLDLPQSISIANGPSLRLLKEKILDEVMESCYEHPTDEFMNMLNRYFNKTDKALAEAVMKVYQGSLMAPDKNTYFETFVERQFNDEHCKQLINYYNSLLIDRRSDILIQIHGVEQAYAMAKDCLQQYHISEYTPNFSKFVEALSSMNCFDDLMTLLQSDEFKLPSLHAKIAIVLDDDLSAIHVLHSALTDSFQKLKDEVKKLHSFTSEELVKNYKSTKPFVQWVVDTAYQLYLRIRLAQQKQHLYDFNDIMDLAIELLENNEDIRTIYRNRYQEIMVDEYQDTNDLQNYLLSLIAKPNNMFLVGDVKQSIYGFRNANPKHFMNKLFSFTEDEQSEVISLPDNFRSRQSVLEPINELFRLIMDEPLGGVRYDSFQQLQYGLIKYDESPKEESAHAPRMIIYPESEDMSPVQQEATWIARDIIEKIRSQFPTLKKDKFEPVTYDDFAILIDRRSDFTQIAQVLKEHGIPVKLYADESYVASTEVLVLINLLKVIISLADESYFNQYFKTSFYGLMRSFIYQIDDEPIVAWFLEHVPLQQSDVNSLRNHPIFQSIMKDLDGLADLVSQLPVATWLLEVLRVTHFNEAMLHLDNVQSIEAKIDFFIQQARSIPGLTVRSFVDLLTQIDEHPEIDLEFQQTPSSHDHGVTIMTIHKSKGLEFPHVYFPRLSKRFTFTEDKSPAVFSSEYGLLLKPYFNGFYHSFVHHIFKHDARREMVSERLRLWYVALTRSRETMTLLAPLKTRKLAPHYLNNERVLAFRIRAKWDSYAAVMNGARSLHRYDKEWGLNPWQPIVDHYQDEPEHTQPLEFINVAQTAQLVEKISYSKAGADSLVDPELLLKGQAFHEQLEHLDLSSVDVLKSLQEPLLSSVKALIESTPFKDRLTAKFYHEYAFIDDNGVKGIIDLLIETPDEMIVVDFKLSNIDDPLYDKQVSGYMNYVSSLTNKKISGYLFSLIKKYMRKVG